MQTFFSTTVHSFMPQFRISEHYYEKRYKTSGGTKSERTKEFAK